MGFEKTEEINLKINLQKENSLSEWEGENKEKDGVKPGNLGLLAQD